MIGNALPTVYDNCGVILITMVFVKELLILRTSLSMHLQSSLTMDNVVNDIHNTQNSKLPIPCIKGRQGHTCETNQLYIDTSSERQYNICEIVEAMLQPSILDKNLYIVLFNLGAIFRQNIKGLCMYCCNCFYQNIKNRYHPRLDERWQIFGHDAFQSLHLACQDRSLSIYILIAS